ncbi:MAG: flagellin [Nitrosopumilaceae archaeon]
MASGIMSEAILIIASVVIATSIAGVVMNQVGVFQSTFTATTESQKDIILTDVKIVYASGNDVNNYVNVWIKNIGVNPIVNANQTDVYFGQIGQVKNYPHNKIKTEDTWRWNSPLPEPTWQTSNTHSINITDAQITTGVTYQLTVTTPNGVSDEYIFSLS